MRRPNPLLLFGLLSCMSPVASDHPEELGRVDWGRDHTAAFELASKLHRPVLLLFQEIPG